MVTCTDPKLPLTVCSAHAPHADRPDFEASEFWNELKLAVLRAPSYRGLLFGIDANADFFASDDDEHLIGHLLAAGEPDRNDMHLLEFCTHLGFAAPSTHAEVQVGPGWSWEHTGGTRKRLDHILFKVGPWDVQTTSQALDLDLGHNQQDHVPLRAVARLLAPRPPQRTPAARRCTASELLAIGGRFWQLLRSKLSPASCPAPSSRGSRTCRPLLLLHLGTFVTGVIKSGRSYATITCAVSRLALLRGRVGLRALLMSLRDEIRGGFWQLCRARRESWRARYMPSLDATRPPTFFH